MQNVVVEIVSQFFKKIHHSNSTLVYATHQWIVKKQLNYKFYTEKSKHVLDLQEQNNRGFGEFFWIKMRW